VTFRYKDWAIDLKDIFAGILVLAVILYLAYSRIITTRQFYQAIGDQTQQGLERFDQLEGRFDRLESKIDALMVPRMRRP
jgi:hypothetical protein